MNFFNPGGLGKDGFAPPTLYTCNPLGCSLATPGAALCAVLPPPPEAAAAPAGHRASADHRARAAAAAHAPAARRSRLLLLHGHSRWWCSSLVHHVAPPAARPPHGCSGSESSVRWILQRQPTGKIRIQCSLPCYAFPWLSILVDEVLLEFGDVLVEFCWKISGYVSSVTLFLSGLIQGEIVE